MAIFNSFLCVYQRVVVQPSQESRSMIQDPLSCRFIIPCWNLQRCWYSQKKCQTMGYTPYKYGVYCILHINMDIYIYIPMFYIFISIFISIYSIYIYMVPPCFDDPRILETKTRPIDFHRRRASSGSVSRAPCVKCQWVDFSQKVFTGNHGFCQLYYIILLFMYIYRLYSI